MRNTFSSTNQKKEKKCNPHSEKIYRPIPQHFACATLIQSTDTSRKQGVPLCRYLQPPNEYLLELSFDPRVLHSQTQWLSASSGAR